jgi:hypothetical protein
MLGKLNPANMKQLAINIVSMIHVLEESMIQVVRDYTIPI